MKIWSIEGNTQKLDGGAMFGNAPRAMWTRWMQPDELNRIPLACRALLVQPVNGKTVLFDTGVGAFFDPKMRDRYGVGEERPVLLHPLPEAGISHEDIDVVVLSHLHFDHAGGLLREYREGQPPELLFPNAIFLTSRPHWERANHPHARDRASFIPELPGLLEASGRLQFVDGGRSDILGDAVSFAYSDGHTPGMMLAEIHGPPGPDGKPHGGVVFCADLVPGRPWVHLPITMGYDRSPELLIDEKTAFLADKLERNVHLFLTHDPEVALVGLSRNERGRYEPVNETAKLSAHELT